MIMGDMYGPWEPATSAKSKWSTLGVGSSSKMVEGEFDNSLHGEERRGVEKKLEVELDDGRLTGGHA